MRRKEGRTKISNKIPWVINIQDTFVENERAKLVIDNDIAAKMKIGGYHTNGGDLVFPYSCERERLSQ